MRTSRRRGRSSKAGARDAAANTMHCVGSARSGAPDPRGRRALHQLGAGDVPDADDFSQTVSMQFGRVAWGWLEQQRSSRRGLWWRRAEPPGDLVRSIVSPPGSFCRHPRCSPEAWAFFFEHSQCRGTAWPCIVQQSSMRVPVDSGAIIFLPKRRGL